MSSRSWLSYSYQSRFHLTPLSYETLEFASGFSSEQCPEGIVAISANTLRFSLLHRWCQNTHCVLNLWEQLEVLATAVLTWDYYTERLVSSCCFHRHYCTRFSLSLWFRCISCNRSTWCKRLVQYIWKMSSSLLKSASLTVLNLSTSDKLQDMQNYIFLLSMIMNLYLCLH